MDNAKRKHYADLHADLLRSLVEDAEDVSYQLVRVGQADITARVSASWREIPDECDVVVTIKRKHQDRDHDTNCSMRIIALLEQIVSSLRNA